MRNLKLTIAYDGSRYKGWQKLKDNEMTIQGKIEKVLATLTEAEVILVGCGRTDAGVHAENYVANFHTKCEYGTDLMLEYLYEFLPEDIVVKSLEDTDERFHARYNVKSKTYVYTINNSRFRDVFTRRYAYHLPERLDLAKMEEAAAVLTGTHDFKSFTNAKGDKSTIRTVNYIEIRLSGEVIEIEINGNGFLWNMVRIISGTLIEVGKGNLSPQEIQKILEAKKRWEAGPMAQAKGLCLRKADY